MSTGSKAFKLDAADKSKIMKSAMFAIAGFVTVLLSVLAGAVDGDSAIGGAIAAAVPFAMNFVMKWTKDNTGRDLSNFR